MAVINAQPRLANPYVFAATGAGHITSNLTRMHKNFIAKLPTPVEGWTCMTCAVPPSL